MKVQDLTPDWAPITPELLDKLNNPDATWPDDPAVPELPPLANTDDPPVSQRQFPEGPLQ